MPPAAIARSKIPPVSPRAIAVQVSILSGRRVKRSRSWSASAMRHPCGRAEQGWAKAFGLREGGEVPVGFLAQLHIEIARDDFAGAREGAVDEVAVVFEDAAHCISLFVAVVEDVLIMALQAST